VKDVAAPEPYIHAMFTAGASEYPELSTELKDRWFDLLGGDPKKLTAALLAADRLGAPRAVLVELAQRARKAWKANPGVSSPERAEAEKLARKLVRKPRRSSRPGAKRGRRSGVPCPECGRVHG
jgi:hypothetical protein